MFVVCLINNSMILSSACEELRTLHLNRLKFLWHSTWANWRLNYRCCCFRKYTDLISTLCEWSKSPGVLVDCHSVVDILLRSCSGEWVFKFLRVELKEWVLSKSNIVLVQIWVLQLFDSLLQRWKLNLIQVNLWEEMVRKRINLYHHIMISWVSWRRWNPEHMEFHFFLVSHIMEFLLHSPV